MAVGPVPHALSDQLNLPEGFGVIVAAVVPGSAADTAGVQVDDVLKMLNDQILVNPEQLSTLVRSFPDGQEASLTAIRKGKEAKLTVKLKKQDLAAFHDHFEGPGRDGDGDSDRPAPRGRPGPHHPGGPGQGLAEGDEDEGDIAPPPPPAPPVRDILRELRPELKNLGESVNRQVADQLQHEITILRERDGASRHTRIDLQDARIIVRDDKGELELKTHEGKRFLTAKDAQGKPLFSGPVNTPDERKAVPADILPRLEKLEKEELPAFPEAPKPDGAATSSTNTSPDGAGPRVSLVSPAASF